ncbi:hypothetical protein CU098_004435 [Rhizopus stolonifer]|uniref:PH domain-containing protein n=1 Tax=Rhizopus stolonifer TaxID=4846 RepID=A0A367KMI7_RHIST|nr:hypothetical protein CU098_004435 [Rhizopus stolonifer]
MNKAPRSGWLLKLTSNTFCASRWQSRYFVLLDSEMRYYKDEHSTNASRTISLRDIAKVTLTNSPNHPHCFRLEPITDKQKVWTIACQSEYELKAWVSAIKLRLSNLPNREQAGLVLSPSLQPFSMPEQKRQQPFLSFTRILTSASAGQEVLSFVQPRLMKRSNFSISRRRGIILSPLDMETIPGLENDMLSSSSSSRGSSSPSPTAIPEEEELLVEEAYASKISVKNAYVMDTSSPSFALYKERIGPF